ncbi:MAG: ABC transporter ATP-binding protein [Alphaproteobacteria bacterium]|nr:ABC transporter ATP-binding protein [Alphaproteobacteria bacterium]
MTERNRSKSLPISVGGVTKTYGRVTALDSVDLEIESGEFMTLLGPSGSGKTTLLMVLAGFTRPDCGSVRFGDAEVVRLPPHKRDLGMVFQSYALFPHMTVAENVAFPLRLRKVGKADRLARAERALQTVQLGGYGDRRIDQLSGGQRQRVALARAIVFEPRILLMDEPLSALDKKLRELMQIELRRLHERFGMTTVYVTHDQREALTMSDRIAVIDDGAIQQLGTPRAIYDHPANRFVADFIGESTILPVTRDGADVLFAGTPLRLAGPPPPGPVSLMIRPERLQLLSGADAADASFNRFEATAESIVFQGESYLMQARLADGQLVALRGGVRHDYDAVTPAPGDRVALGVHVEDTILLPGADGAREADDG